MISNATKRLKGLDEPSEISALDLVYNRQTCRYLMPSISARDDSTKHILKEIGWSRKKGFTGAGMRVGIVDTGLMWDHPALRNKCAVSKDFTNSKDDLDHTGHGTLVALLILLMVPDVVFVSAKALDDDGFGSPGQFKSAIRWIGEQGCRVINISMGIETDEQLEKCRCEICYEVDRLAFEKDICICAALGNDHRKTYHPGVATNAITTTVRHIGGFPEYITKRAETRRLPAATFCQPGYFVKTQSGEFDGGTSMATAFLSGHFCLTSQVAELLLDTPKIQPGFLEGKGVPKHLIAAYYSDEGTKCYQLGEAEEAIRWLKLALKADPANFGAHFNLALAYRLRSEWEAAISELKWVLEQNDQFIAAHIELGHIYEQRREIRKAVKEFATALQIDPSNWLAMRNLAVVLANCGKIAEAKPLFGKVIELNYNDAIGHNGLGMISEIEGRLDAALEFYEIAIALAPHWELPARNRARVIEEMRL